MNIQGTPRFEPPKPKPPVQPETKEFSYNPQDPSVMSEHPVAIDDVVVKDGKPETDTVKLANKKAVFGPFGRLRDIKDDPGFKLEAKEDGSFNYAPPRPSTNTTKFTPSLPERPSTGPSAKNSSAFPPRPASGPTLSMLANSRVCTFSTTRAPAPETPVKSSLTKLGTLFSTLFDRTTSTEWEPKPARSTKPSATSWRS